ncbi:histidine phosphatase family protein [Mycolicibacter sinensis]|uniref:histidine phosphatase family protein n=1 Tax=Mycolicibacter sinensis (strain JDM601) TaxID=875328 RepID=UPI000673D4BE
MSTVRLLVAIARQGGTVAALTHGGVINVILRHALGTAKLFPFRIDFAAVSDLRCSPDGAPIVVGVNCVDHVSDLLPLLQKRWPCAPRGATARMPDIN